jgi:predicted outer membrane repeat protein
MSTTFTVNRAADNNKAGSLRHAIANARAGDTIQFAARLANQTLQLKNTLTIAAGKNITIDGSNAPGLTISGNRTHRIFLVQSTHVNPTRVVFKRLRLVDGFTRDRGGAISTEHQASVVVRNVQFANNKANRGGGAIFSAYEGNLTVLNSQFRGNDGTGANDERGAGAIAFWGPNAFTVRNSRFINNRGINGGAINSLTGKLTVENSRFVGNTTTAGRYDANQPNPSLRGYGGAIYTDRASLANSKGSRILLRNNIFENNKGRGEGGAAYLYSGQNDRVIVDGSVFRNNEVVGLSRGAPGNGGALVHITNGPNRGFTLQNTSFVNNIANNQGGGAWIMDAPTTISNVTFTRNRTRGDDVNRNGGALLLRNAETSIVNSTFAYNRAGWVGGAITGGTNASIRNTIFYNNTADNGPNSWNIQQHSSNQLRDRGGNYQWPPEQNSSENVSSSVNLADPRLGKLQQDSSGFYYYPLLRNSPASGSGSRPLSRSLTRSLISTPEPAGRDRSLAVQTSEGLDDSLLSPSNSDPTQRQPDRSRDRPMPDLLTGQTNDSLVGNGGPDRLLGRPLPLSTSGLDARIYRITGDRGHHIVNFDPSRDQLDLSSMIPNSNRAATAFRDAIHLTQVGSRTVVSVNGDGIGQPPGQQTMIILNHTQVSDLQVSNFRL